MGDESIEILAAFTGVGPAGEMCEARRRIDEGGVASRNAGAA